jgi:small subunit ribosomal protein S16
MVNLKEALTLEWLRKGAQPTATVLRLLRQNGIWSQFKQPKSA